jgi:hypothetical protein
LSYHGLSFPPARDFREHFRPTKNPGLFWKAGFSNAFGHIFLFWAEDEKTLMEIVIKSQ